MSADQRTGSSIYPNINNPTLIVHTRVSSSLFLSKRTTHCTTHSTSHHTSSINMNWTDRVERYFDRMEPATQNPNSPSIGTKSPPSALGAMSPPSRSVSMIQSDPPAPSTRKFWVLLDDSQNPITGHYNRPTVCQRICSTYDRALLELDTFVLLNPPQEFEKPQALRNWMHMRKPEELFGPAPRKVRLGEGYRYLTREGWQSVFIRECELEMCVARRLPGADELDGGVSAHVARVNEEVARFYEVDDPVRQVVKLEYSD